MSGGDSSYAMRWRCIKEEFTERFLSEGGGWHRITAWKAVPRGTGILPVFRHTLSRVLRRGVAILGFGDWSSRWDVQDHGLEGRATWPMGLPICLGFTKAS
jgi:hypothetical protein